MYWECKGTTPVSITKHPDSKKLQAGLTRCLPLISPVIGLLCRACGARYANQADLLSGQGAKWTGGRWNPPGLFPVVYGSLDPFAALAETIGAYGHYAIPFEQRMPLVMVGIAAELQRALDFTDPDIRRRLSVSMPRMMAANWESSQLQGKEALTQALGRLAWELQLEGLVVPSARLKKERNLVIFPDHLLPTSRLEIVNREELPEQL
ncbi:MAG: RES family NAD+ phosphorylase [Pirellulales bacterium]